MSKPTTITQRSPAHLPMPNHGDARSLFPTAKQSAALWLAQQESVPPLTGGQNLSQTAIRPFCHMKKQHVNKTQWKNTVLTAREDACLCVCALMFSTGQTSHLSKAWELNGHSGQLKLTELEGEQKKNGTPSECCARKNKPGLWWVMSPSNSGGLIGCRGPRLHPFCRVLGSHRWCNLLIETSLSRIPDAIDLWMQKESRTSSKRERERVSE